MHGKGEKGHEVGWQRMKSSGTQITAVHRFYTHTGINTVGAKAGHCE